MTICLFNYLGYDDKNIIIFLSNPLNTITEGWVSDFNSKNNKSAYYFALYSTHLLFWLAAGVLIDIVISKVRKRK